MALRHRPRTQLVGGSNHRALEAEAARGSRTAFAEVQVADADVACGEMRDYVDQGFSRLIVAHSFGRGVR